MGRKTRKTLTPQAWRATNSRSADRRPRPNKTPYNRAIGIVTLRACGIRVIRTCRITVHETPFAISFSAF